MKWFVNHTAFFVKRQVKQQKDQKTMQARRNFTRASIANRKSQEPILQPITAIY